MKIAARQLARHLDEALAPSYLIAGDEPLLVAEAADRVRAAARAAGFDERELHVVDRSFRWNELEADAGNLSLFGSRKLVELRLPSPRPGDAGARTLRALAEDPQPDRLLLVTIGARLDASAAKSVWAKSLEKSGVLVEVWPVDRAELPRWIRERAAALELELTSSAAELLADRVEGNLLAADQELQKLALTSDAGAVDESAILAAVANSARFDVFRLTDAVVAGDGARAVRVLTALKREGAQPALVGWALAREIGLLARLKFAVEAGESLDAALGRQRVFRRRQPAVKRAVGRYSWPALKQLLTRAAETDATIKGAAPGRPWDALTALVAATLTPAATRPAGRHARRG